MIIFPNKYMYDLPKMYFTLMIRVTFPFSFKSNVLVEVTSNIWGTKFKIHGVAPFLPVDLGQVLYKTSLLHLQPRQMTVTITEMSGDLRPSTCDDRTAYNPNSFSESEDEMNGG